MRILASTLVLAALTALAPAQACATLSVSGTGAPGTDLVFDLQGQANAPAVLLVGTTAGTTTLQFGPLGSLELGLEFPFLAAPLGRTDANGDISRTITVPSQIQSADLIAQGLTFTFTFTPSFSLSFCTSNLAPFHVGT